MILPLSPAADFVAECRDRLQDALEQQNGIQGAGGEDEEAAQRAAHASVLSQFAFGFQGVAAPKV